ncbi:MAG: rRNA maturation RNase YbeY [Planctomycetota bacterium]
MRLLIDRLNTQPVPSNEQIEEAVHALLGRDGVVLPDGLIEVKFCSDEDIQKINAEFLEETAITDVIAFELLEVDPETGELIIGSIAVNHDLAVRNATEHVQNMKLDDSRLTEYVASEIVLYVLHGILHFAGYDDEFPEDRKEMFDIAAEVLSRLGHPIIPYE